MDYKIQIDDLVRDANAEEIAEIKALEALAEAQKKEEELLAAKKAATGAKLEALGLTPEDLAVLGL